MENLQHIEDILDQHAEPGIISMSEHVSECISASITSSAGIDNDLESFFEADTSFTPPPLISNLTHYFYALPVSSLPPVPGSASIDVSEKSLSNTHRSLIQYLETQKKQSSLDSWLHRS
ncbi:hypothetical protein L211DRAFT_837507 [Terfezia boudieri ATCC MYA-4762]|uniref:Uncharacterized protein n=1 Tax=Terfezia boudieri ATCC MYA-4762 TaxID=1051890 RepID=A0A3N4LP36_9PEZI|nr:hypothetical protein L211DRAFT_837507 [Terfezia boudieri ATCC MYA-4762]